MGTSPYLLLVSLIVSFCTAVALLKRPYPTQSESLSTTMMLKQAATIRPCAFAGSRRIRSVHRTRAAAEAEQQTTIRDSSANVQSTLSALDSLLPVEPVQDLVASTSKPSTNTSSTSSSVSSSSGWQNIANSASSNSSSSNAQTKKAQQSFESVMGFEGLAPELINGRAAMLGFVAAMINETHGDSLFTQVMSGGFISAGQIILLVVLASFAPAVRKVPFDKMFGKDKQPASWGPFGPTAELINGRAAMLGLLTLMFLEGTSGQPFFL